MKVFLKFIVQNLNLNNKNYMVNYIILIHQEYYTIYQQEGLTILN